MNPSSISISGNKGGVDSIQIAHTTGWTVTVEPSTTSWLKLSATSGMGNAKVFITAEENNTSGVVRNATIIIKSTNTQVAQQTLQVSQKLAEFLPFHTLVGGSNLDQFEDVIVLNDGYLAVGSTLSNGGNVTLNKGKSDLWVVKFDKSGTLIWQKSYGGTENDYGYGALATSDGFVLAGTTWSANGDVVGNKGFSDAWLLKLDTNGNLQWQKTFGGSGPDDALAISSLPSGGFVMTGKTESADGDIVNLDPGSINVVNAMVIKTDNAGNKVWAKAVGPKGSEAGTAITSTSDGGCVVLGRMASLSSFPSEPIMSKGSWDYYVFRLNANGDLLWQKNYGGRDNDYGRAITPTTDGGFVLAGYTNTINDGDVTGWLGGSDGWLVKIGPDGSAIWKKTVGSNGDDDVYDVLEVGTDLYLAGYIQPAVSTNGWDGWVSKFNSTGGNISQRSFGGSDKDQVNALKLSGAGNFVGAGFSLSNNQNVAGQKGSGDAWIFTYRE